MSRHTFLKSSSVWGDESETVNILSVADVDKLIAKKIGPISLTVDRLILDNRKLKAENRKLQKLCKTLADELSGLTVKGRSLTDCLAQVEELQVRMDRLPADCAGLFESVIGEVLAPKLDLFARQIGVALPATKPKVGSEKKIRATKRKLSEGKPTSKRGVK